MRCETASMQRMNNEEKIHLSDYFGFQQFPCALILQFVQQFKHFAVVSVKDSVASQTLSCMNLMCLVL